eukprot:CAMPEP_0202866436 /NCGR_PEP_ID=MMETSP1391-20130828/7532_1 /ASSEMBLY_ACC=CAM_ASM_000867 /TAXON_ID=1034604 /ORGANISM="Chlamydomonas leiostraca, Strain SAG 11-49" /LENGTH=319 /DNA_ID=CAMNT_0049546379 /DNA_START=170 /DNA_END=1130 /DNA_ORIENTATION=+
MACFTETKNAAAITPSFLSASQEESEQVQHRSRTTKAELRLPAAAPLASGLAAASWFLNAGIAAASDASASAHSSTLLDWMLMGLLCYWVIRVLSYSMGVDPFSGPVGRDRRDSAHGAGSSGSGGKKQEQEQPEQEEGLTGMTHAHVRSYVDMTKETRDPDAIAVRNRALAIAATYSVAVAVKEAVPRIRQLLRELTAMQVGQGSLPKPHAATSDPVALMVWEVLCGLEARAGAPAHVVWERMLHSEHERLVAQLTEAVAERAAMEQVEGVVRVARAAHAAALGEGGQGGQGGPSSQAGGSHTSGKGSNGRDIRGGGAH